MEASPPTEGGGIPAFFAMKESTEVVVEIVTQATLCTAAAREAMYRTAEWKQKSLTTRTAGVFVPLGYGENAKEVLGLYDFCVEYSF